jgi:hypothetical protein
MINSIKQKTIALSANQTIIFALIGFIFVAILSYVYFANMTVRTLTVLEKAEDHMQSLSVEVSEMESKRLTAENSISTEKALLLGFVQVENPTFIMKGHENAALSLKMN